MAALLVAPLRDLLDDRFPDDVVAVPAPASAPPKSVAEVPVTVPAEPPEGTASTPPAPLEPQLAETPPATTEPAFPAAPAEPPASVAVVQPEKPPLAAVARAVQAVAADAVGGVTAPPMPDVAASATAAALSDLARGDVTLAAPPLAAVRAAMLADAPRAVGTGQGAVAAQLPLAVDVSGSILPARVAAAAAGVAAPALPNIVASGQGAVPSGTTAADVVLVFPLPTLGLSLDAGAPLKTPLTGEGDVVLPAQPFELAETPVEPPAAPAVPDTKTLPPPDPTIDAIELSAGGSFVAGDGPAGAVMRLYLDGKPVGESPVEGGRWVVDSVPLFDSPTQELRVEAVEPGTGRVLGEAAVTVEVEVPEEAPVAEPPAEPPADVTEEPADEPVPDTTETPDETEEPAEAEPPVTTEPEVDDPPAETEDEPAAPPAPESEDEPVPPLQPVVPRADTGSVVILAAPEDAAEPLLAPVPSEESSVIELEPPEPALTPKFIIPLPEADATPTVLYLLPFGQQRFETGSAIIRRGDTLWSLARRYYGHGVHFRTILNANREQIRRASRIYPGQVIELPLVTEGNWPP